MSELVEKNLREYLFCMPRKTNQGNVSGVREQLTATLIDCKSNNLKNLMGIIVEFGTIESVDALTIYSDGVIAWYDGDKQNMIEAELKGQNKCHLDLIVEAAHEVLKVAEPSEYIPQAPPPGYAMVSIITPKGISYGAGKSRDMATDTVSGPIIKEALLIRQKILQSQNQSH